MSVKRGYKQTDVGVIPEEWEVANLGEHARFRTGPFGSALHKSDYTVDGVPVINPMHIVDGGLSPTSMMSVTPAAVRMLSEFCLLTGDVVIGRRGDMGRCAVVRAEHNGWLCGTGSMIVRSGDRYDPGFLQRVLSSPQVIGAIENASVGTTMANLNQGVLGRLRLQRPPLPEQRAIAAALSDVDALIASLDRLIAKKRDLKQAAMQQLLTGQARLPGFGGKWETTLLGRIGIWLSGGTPSKSTAHYWEGSIPWVSPKDMKIARLHDAIDHVSPLAIGNGTRLLPAGAILVVVRGMILAHSAPVARAERALAFNQDIKGLVVREGVDSNFILWWLAANEATLLSTTNESTHGTKRIPTESLFALSLILPDLAEQTAIATVLSDMDAELTALEQRRDKTKLLKQGMMQELLTGKTRLV